MVNQVQDRNSLFSSNIQTFLQRRGQELAGVFLLFGSIVLSFILLLFTFGLSFAKLIFDETFLSNFQVFSSSIAAPMIVTIGLSSWILSIFMFIWAIRLIFHLNANSFFNRVVFLPILVALSSIFASGVPALSSWPHSFGLGGLFGDTIFASLISIMPNGMTFGSWSIIAIFGTISFIISLFVFGFDKRELKKISKLLLLAVLYILKFQKIFIKNLFVSIFKLLFFRMRKKNKDTTIVEKSGFFIKRQNSDLDTKTLIEPDIKNLNISELDLCIPENIKIDNNVELGNGDSLRSKISQAVKNQNLKTTKDTDIQIDENDGLLEDFQDEMGSFQSVKRSRQFVATKPLVVPVAAPPQPSKAAIKERQPSLDFHEREIIFETPPLSLLSNPTQIVRHHLSDEALEENARMLENVLDDYGVKGDIVSVRPGPVVTMYELEPAPGLKASRVIGLAEDIARSMSALSARVSTLPGRSVIGIELPNLQREKVVLREILAARDYGDSNVKLPLALGKDIGGEAVVANLSKMPHLLIAGTTGSGKSVAINTMILSLLYKLTPAECRLIMIDPKMLELSVYDGIPHLLSPVVTDPKKAVVALKWVVGEMEERYRKMSKMGVRNIDGYNGRVKDTLDKGEMFSKTIQTGFDDQTGEPVFETEEFVPQKLPYIVVVVDEMADLMMVAGKEIEACIQRLAQMARASGIHLIMATQRPSVDVITGTIKANFPTRISFQVTSKIDSRTILGEQGAEQLLGMGDMLYMAGGGKITRVHAPFVSDEEVEEIVTHLKNFGPPVYVNGVVEGNSVDKENSIDQVLGLSSGPEGEDAEYDQAVAILLRDRKCSTSYIQRKMAIGYNKAARLVERMEEEGLVSQANHVGKRIILVPEQNL
jgi:S-DNA-T family DNA segregation ATPase FtsK/SpoIIIE